MNHANKLRVFALIVIIPASLYFLLNFSRISPDASRGNQSNVKRTIQLFNGKSLEGWIPKFKGFPLGFNYNNTFRVEDGVLKVSYDQYTDWNGEFGHLYYDKPFEKYVLNVTYRFHEEQYVQGKDYLWAKRNNGLMLHCQDPSTILLDQAFPISIEAQLLGAIDEVPDRTDLNLCTPGLNVYIGDSLVTKHCISSTLKSLPDNTWVEAQFVVYGDSIMHHIYKGDTVISYERPQLGGTYLPENFKARTGEKWGKGYIAIQAETQPIEFKKIELILL